jgi:hypothetical protein
MLMLREFDLYVYKSAVRIVFTLPYLNIMIF